MTGLILILSAICLLRVAAVQAVCPSVAGYVFYQLQDVPGAWVINATNATSVSQISAACNALTLCNAFDTLGKLKLVPMIPSFSYMDSTASDTLECDGIYIASKTLSGLVLPPGEDFNTVRNAGNERARNMQAAIAAANKVAAKLREKGRGNQRPDTLPYNDVRQAFIESGTPLAQYNAVTGSYTYSDVLAALSDPAWDSRLVNGTSRSFISPVKDQGSCGSCVSFAVTGMAEAVVGAVNNVVSNTNDFSEQWLFFCNGLYTPSCNTGWYASAAVDVLVRRNIPMEVNYPYTGSSGCTLRSSPEVRTSGTFSSRSFSDLTSVKTHIRTYGSVTSYFAVYNDFFSWLASSPPYSWNGYSALAGYHQVLTIGYNDTGSFWIVKNSWGTGWGDRGYFRISYNAGVGFMAATGSNVLGVAWARSAAPSPPPPSPTPSVCGDGSCASTETCSSCPSDCGACNVCGDGRCSGGETCTTCPGDCRTSSTSLICCGDGICNANAGETCATCPSDCGVCPTCNKNNICEPSLGERCLSGSTGCADCGTCSSNYCGDGRCTWARYTYTESCSICAADCGSCSGLYCGDGICSPSRNESSLTCPRDCGKARFAKVTLGQAGNNGNGNGGGSNNSGNNGNGNGNNGGHRRSLHEEFMGRNN